MAETRIIKLSIANRKYPVRVSKTDEKEEEVLRRAAKIIDKKMQQYQKKFSNKEIFDILAMASLQITQELIINKSSSASLMNDSDLIELSDSLDEILEE